MIPPAAVDEIRAALVALGLDPGLVDLPWVAAVKADAEARIAAGRSDPGFADAVPFSSSVRQDGAG